MTVSRHRPRPPIQPAATPDAPREAAPPAAVTGPATPERARAEDVGPAPGEQWFEDADQLRAPRDGRPSPLVFQGTASRAAAHRLHQGFEATTPRISEAQERGTVAAANGAHLVPLSEGRPDRPMTVTVHGINASPDDVTSLSGRAIAAGDAVRTLAYDDQHTGLEATSRAFANDVGAWLRENPGRPLRIDAHSMGGRVALRGLHMLQQEGALNGRQVELNLIASPINGMSAANMAAMANLPLMGPIRNIPGVVPGVDMGSLSGFQDRLNEVRFDDNVHVRVFTAGDDSIVNPNGDFMSMVGRLEAVRVHLPNATHGNAPDHAAAWLESHP